MDIVLYRYNAVDARLWSLICRSRFARRVENHSIVIGAPQLKDILLQHFRTDINKIRVVESSMVYKDATSVYFIWKMLEEMLHLGWIKINLSLNANYSRVVSVDQLKTIRFSTKIIRGTFRTFDHFNKNELPLVNWVYRQSGVLNSNRPYNRLQLVDMLNRLDLFLSEHNTNEVGRVVDVTISELERFETDNPEVLIVTDWA